MAPRLLTIMAIAATISVLPLHETAAHVAYKDIQASDPTPTIRPDGSITYRLRGVVQSNGAWANAADHDWGNSHDTPWYKFTISPGGAFIDLSVAGGIRRVPGHRGRVLGDLTPAFSLYSGLLPPYGHDNAPPAFPIGKDGAWRALADTTLGNRAGEVATITYITHGGAVNSRARRVRVMGLFLPPGDYSVALGGACYECWPHYERLDPGSPYHDPTYAGERLRVIEEDRRRFRGYRLSLTVRALRR